MSLEMSQNDKATQAFILPQEYIHFSPVNAEIWQNNTRRTIALDINFLSLLDEQIREQDGENYLDILYQIGEQWGQNAYSYVESLIHLVYPDYNSINELSMDQFHAVFTNHLAAMGWGNFELKRRDDLLFVDLFNSLYVDVVQNPSAGKMQTGGTVCQLYGGFFSGIFTKLSNMELSCMEITCRNEGYEHCSFLLDNIETINQLNTYIYNGLKPLEAYEKLKKDIDELSHS
jgi:predicted hydrocarbon binding protein